MKDKKRPNRTEIVGVRLTPQERNQIEEFAFDEEMTMGQLFRKAVSLYIGGFLDEYDVPPED